MSIRFLTAGESHGKCLNAIIEGVPAGFLIKKSAIDNDLQRRQKGYGRGGRMQIETDTAEIKSGVRFGISLGSPICLEIRNKDWENWKPPMSTEALDLTDEEISKKISEKRITNLRPGHADCAGAIKYDFDDVRNVLERSSARETAARVAVGAICKQILKEFNINGFSHVIEIGNICANISDTNYNEISKKAENSELRCADEKAENLMKQEIEKAKELGTSLGGKVEIVFENLPIGLGSYVHWDKRLDGLLAQALMSIPAVKAVEIGLGIQSGKEYGSQVHDEIFYKNGEVFRNTNNAGGIEGGMTNGEPLVIKITMKPIPTMTTPLKSIDIKTKEPAIAHVERADVCAVPACGVVAEAMTAYVLTNAFLEKFGSDNIKDIKASFEHYKNRMRSV